MSVNKKIIEVEATPPSDPQFAIYTNQSNSAAGGTMGNIGFQPDMSWHRTLARAEYFHCYNSSLDSPTSLKRLNLNDTGAFGGTPFGFTYGSGNGGSFYQPSGNTGFNNTSEQNLHLFFKGNAGTTSTNTAGTLTSTVQVNQTAGFSIVEWTGTQNNQTIGHGLNSAPKLIICKNDFNAGWPTLFIGSSTSYRYYGLRLNSNGADNSGNGALFFQSYQPSSTVFKVGANDENNKSGAACIAFCFTEISGFSKIGSYNGNGSNAGPTVTTGFEPKFIMIKAANTTGNWNLFDAARSSSNPRIRYMTINGFPSEQSNIGGVDFNSTSFQIKSGDSQINASGTTYLYWVIGGNDTNAINCVPSYSN